MRNGEATVAGYRHQIALWNEVPERVVLGNSQGFLGFFSGRRAAAGLRLVPFPWREA
jgi:hypothetical protein